MTNLSQVTLSTRDSNKMTPESKPDASPLRPLGKKKQTEKEEKKEKKNTACLLFIHKLHGREMIVNDWEGNGRGLLQDYVSLKIYGLCAENRI
jgi:hypothetical protein